MSITRRRSTAAIDGVTTRSTGNRRARAWHRLGRGALIVAAGTAALALAGPMALRPFVDAADSAGAAGLVSVAFVLDFGPGSTPVAGCVNVPDTDTRYDALSAFVHQEGMAPPTYAPSGLLCSINVVPATGCGQTVAGGYIYWSYFTGGSGGWSYSSTGASATVTPGDVEGWRFQNPGTGRPNDPAPRSTPRFNSICSAGSGTPSTNPGTKGGTGPGAGRHPHIRWGAAAPAAAGTGRPGGSPTTTTSSSTTTTTSTYPSATDTSLPDISVPADPVAALAHAKHPAGGSGPGPDPLIIGGLLVAALGIAAFARWRRRLRTP
jgi:hypothetical protein